MEPENSIRVVRCKTREVLDGWIRLLIRLDVFSRVWLKEKVSVLDVFAFMREFYTNMDVVETQT